MNFLVTVYILEVEGILKKKYLKSFSFSGNSIGCLLIHGFTGSPGEMLPLGLYLEKCGFTVKGVLLPGHGTTPEEMHKTNWHMWYEEVWKEYQSLKSICSKVYIIGLSMGGLLSLHLAANENVNGGVIPICAPIFLANKKAYITPYVHYFKRYHLKRESKSNLPSFWYDRYPTRCVASLVGLVKQVKLELSEITCPSLVIQAKKDKTVFPESAEYIYDNLNSKIKKICWLENSGHIATLDVEKENLFERISKFIVRDVRGENL